MRHRIPLPEQLGPEFSVRRAAALGIRRGRVDAADLVRPFHGVRSVAPPESFRARVDCYLPRMRPEQRFVGRTAVRLWALPLSEAWCVEEELEVASPQEHSPPRAAGVRGRRLGAARARTWHLRGAPVVDPVAAVFSCAGELSVRELVVLLDALLTGCSHYPGLDEAGRPRLFLHEVETRLDEWGRFRGSGKVGEALRRAREGVESPKETETRLVIVDLGLPEPEVQFVVRDGSRFVARVDLAYPELRIAIEYEGDGHRTDKAQWRKDIARQRDLEGCGWLVIRLTQSDLDDPGVFLACLRRALSSRVITR